MIRKFYECSITHPTMFFCLSVVIYFSAVLGIGIARFAITKIILSIFTSLAAGKLFVIGHDACHGSFTPNKRLNRAFAASALTMSFHLPGAWRFWHNAVHHGFTNDLIRDFVWRPMSSMEYQSASPLRRRLERL